MHCSTSANKQTSYIYDIIKTSGTVDFPQLSVFPQSEARQSHLVHVPGAGFRS